MATKVKDGRRLVTNELRRSNCSTNPISSSTRLIGPQETWEGVFHRPLPKIRKVTYLRYRESTYHENRVSGCKRHSRSTQYRSGDMSHCHNTATGSYRDFDSRSDVATATVLAKARFTSHSYAETLAESRQTSRMIGNRIGMLGTLASAIRARNRVKADRIAARMRGEQYVYEKPTQGKPISRRFADGWLEYQFGWLPLLSDIYGLVDLYKGRLERGMQVSRSYSTNGGFSPSRGGTTIQKAGRIMRDGAAAKVAIRTRVTNPTTRTLSEMGLVNPMALAWDLLPYSFVVDWLLPISSILKSLLYGVGLEDYDSYSVTEYGDFMPISVACCGPFVIGFSRTVIRQPLSPGVLPGLFTNPRDMGLWHIITATALLRQTMNGGRIR